MFLNVSAIHYIPLATNFAGKGEGGGWVPPPRAGVMSSTLSDINSTAVKLAYVTVAQ